MSAGDFLDTNVLVYAFSTDPRATVAVGLLKRGCTVSTQGLNEFANIARRKLGMSWLETRTALGAIRTLSKVVVPALSAHELAVTLSERHQFPFFDAHMIATALQSGCTRFWSEDLHHGMVVEGALALENPFAKDPTPASA